MSPGLFVLAIAAVALIFLGIPAVKRWSRGVPVIDEYPTNRVEARIHDDGTVEAIGTPEVDDRAVLIRAKTESMAIPILPGFEDDEPTVTYDDEPTPPRAA
jgi:hypothetical protein